MQPSWRILPALCAALWLGQHGCARSDYARLYHEAPSAPSFTQASIAALDHLGATVVDRGVNFGVYSEHATRLEVLLFDGADSPRPTRQFPMTRFGNVWNVHIEGIGLGQAYGYIAFGPNWTYDPAWYPGSIKGFVADVDAQGNRFNPNKLLFDPYSQAITRDHDWSKGSLASGPARTEVTYGAGMKSLVVQSKYQWSPAETAFRSMRLDPNAKGHRAQDVILYEVHPKGFTASPASGVQHPGTFRGVGEKADYFKELGITAVELMPVMEKPLDGGYWGYQTIGFFTPEITYSSDQRPGGPHEEFKWMVDQLHQRGLEVILDVVYNHTGEGGLWRNKVQYDDSPSDPATVARLFNFDPKEVAGLYSFRGLDNAAYYALSPDNQTYFNNTGVGNDTRCNHAPMRRLILDSLRFWAEQMHVDGFRFDLAPILGEKDLDYNSWDDLRFTVLQDIVDDPRLQKLNTRIFAEPWAAGGPGFKLGKFPAALKKDGVGWGEWNGHFRDWWRSFMNNDSWSFHSVEGDPASDGTNFGDLITGSGRLFQSSGRRPYHSANFVTVHDGFPMYDVFTYGAKRNGCGLLNPVCCNDPTSPFCTRDSGETNNRSREWSRCANTGAFCSTLRLPNDPDPCNGNACVPQEAVKRQLMRNLFVAMAVSRGTPLLLGGDEWLRTQLGNNDAYSTLADNPWNWFDWGVWQTHDEAFRMKDFVAQLNHFRTANIGQVSAASFEDAAPIDYKSEKNDLNPNWDGRHMMLHYRDASHGAPLVVLFNLEAAKVTFTLPGGTTWRRVVDTQGYFDTQAYLTTASLPTRLSANASMDAPVVIAGTTYEVADHSIVILQGGP